MEAEPREAEPASRNPEAKGLQKPHGHMARPKKPHGHMARPKKQKPEGSKWRLQKPKPKVSKNQVTRPTKKKGTEPTAKGLRKPKSQRQSTKAKRPESKGLRQNQGKPPGAWVAKSMSQKRGRRPDTLSYMALHQTDQVLPNKNPPETTNSADLEGSR